MDRRNFLKTGGLGAFALTALSARDVLAQELCDPRHVLELDATPGCDHRLVEKPWGYIGEEEIDPFPRFALGRVNVAMYPNIYKSFPVSSRYEKIFDSEGSGRRMIRWKGLDREPLSPRLIKELQMCFRFPESDGVTAWIFFDTRVYEGRDFTMWESVGSSFSIEDGMRHADELLKRNPEAWDEMERHPRTEIYER